MLRQCVCQSIPSSHTILPASFCCHFRVAQLKCVDKAFVLLAQHRLRIRSFVQKVEEHQVREVLKCIIHTIIFNRALGHVSPRDMDLQLINVSYVEVADDDIERQVEEGLRKVEEYMKTLSRSATAHGHQVCAEAY